MGKMEKKTILFDKDGNVVEDESLAVRGVTLEGDLSFGGERDATYFTLRPEELED